MEIYNNKDTEIRCPNCNRLLTVADKRDGRKKHLQCKRCRKLIAYIPATGYREVKDVPERVSASGMRFY